ncbi:MAG: hypothetical protein HUJ65_05360 [Oscillospiraceae bacterium]|nr:hypothetical protein [Oscillospiraceae bacterium]
MIRENQQLFNRLNMISDGLITALSMLIAYWLRYIVFRGDKAVKLGSYVWLAVISALVSFFIYAIMGLYESHRIKRFEHESQKIFLGAVLDTIVLIAALVLSIVLSVVAAVWIMRSRLIK